MSRALLALVCGLALTNEAFSQNPRDPEGRDPEGLHLTYDAAHDEYTATWCGVAGRTYFIQHSGDLIAWNYLQDIVKGEGASIAYCFPNPGVDRFFLRLKWVASVPGDPRYADSDGDRVPNDIEFLQGTDPLSFRDRDFDDMPDDWEFRFGLLPDNDDADADFDLDGISNRLEYQTGPGGGDPTDYYNAASPGDLPLIEYISGALQRGDPGTFSAQPLVLKLTRQGAPVGFVPITLFTPSASIGQISETNDGNGRDTSLTLRTGADGRVSVYFKHPAAIPVVPLQSRGIRARVGSAALGGVSISNVYTEITVYDYTYPANTVGLSASEAIDSRIAGKVAATALP